MIRILKSVIIAGIVFLSVLYFLAVGPYWKLTPDSVTYVLGGKSLAAGKGYVEGKAPVAVYPPGASAILAAGWIAGRGSYRLLNAEVVAFSLASAAISFLLFRDSLGVWGSSLVVLLILGSSEFFHWSTFLLSDIFYLFSSLLALWFYKRNHILGTALALAAACSIRMIGVTLAAAVLVDGLGRRKQSRDIAATTAPALLFFALWELRNVRRGMSNIGLLLQNEPWVAERGHVSVVGLAHRFFSNLSFYRDFQTLLTNGLAHQGIWAFPLAILLAIGCWRLFSRGDSVYAIYAIFLSGAITLYYPWVETRWLLPLLPILFAYLVAGVQEIGDRTDARWAFAAFALFAGLFLQKGIRDALIRIPQERSSLFANQPVKFLDNYAMQTLGLWWKDHTLPGSHYACQFPYLMGTITGTDGVFYPLTDRPAELERDFHDRGIRYILVDPESTLDGIVLRAIEQSDRFHLLKAEKRVRLYEFEDTQT